MSKQQNPPVSHIVSPPTLRTPEAAAYLNVKPATLEQWRWSGGGPLFCKLNRSIRYRQSDLDAYLEARIFGNTTEAGACTHAMAGAVWTRLH